MNNSTRQVLDTVLSIVNKDQTTTDRATKLIFESICAFESLFEPLTEEQEQYLIDLAISYMKNPISVNVNLNESIDYLIENHSPQEVFIALLEMAAPPISPSIIKAPQVAIDSAEEEEEGRQEETEEERKKRLEAEARADSNTLNPYGSSASQLQAAAAGVMTQPGGNVINRSPMMNEENQTLLKKHKKKIFKISFMEKGEKKKGAAVSHKGVMRIVSGKSHFKVYDEKNRDVTSEFKSKIHSHKKKK